MLTAHQIYKSFAAQSILVDVTFSINPGERVGLIGPNGCGKTTLLRILAGEEQPDSGHIDVQGGRQSLGYLRQGQLFPVHLTVDQVLQSCLGDPQKLEIELSRLAGELAENPGEHRVQAAYDLALNRLQSLDAGKEGRLSTICRSLELDNLPANTPAARLSGGQKTRLALACIMIQEPELLLLDEPTNHLDIEMLRWLELWLLDYTGRRQAAALIVSHDRALLDHTVERILVLRPESHTIRSYTGNYSAYFEQYLSEKEKEVAAYRDQVYEIRRMWEDIARTKQQAVQVELVTTSRQPGPRRYAKKVARKAKAREKKLDRYLASGERLEKPKAGWQMKLDFEAPTHLGQDVLHLEALAVGYPDQMPLLEKLDLDVRQGERIVLSGANGCGKTTLLRTIAGQLTPQGGRLQLGPNVRLGFMTQEQELLDPHLSALQTVQRLAAINETEARSFLHFFLFSGDDALRPSGALSFGERARLALAGLVVQGSNFLLLDEPINHLDIPSRERFEQALANFNGTILAVVHDRYFIARFATRIWQVQARFVHDSVVRTVL